MSYRNTQLVLFDLDGTLVDSAPDLAYSLNVALETLGFPTHPVDSVREWIGSGAERLVKRGLTGTLDGEPDTSIFNKAFELFSEIYTENTSKRSQLYPGVQEAITYLQASNRLLGCVTNKRERFTHPLLRALNIFDDFSVVVSGDTLEKKKPDPLPLIYAANYLKISLDKTLMVGDSINDVEAARAAGCPVVGVDYGYNNGQSIATSNPDLILHTLADLPKHI